MSSKHQEAAENGAGQTSAVAPPSSPYIGPPHPSGPPPAGPDENGDCGFKDHGTDNILRSVPRPPAGNLQPRGRFRFTGLDRNDCCDSFGSNDASVSRNISFDSVSLPKPSTTKDGPGSDKPGAPSNESSGIRDRVELTMALTRENLARVLAGQVSVSQAPKARGSEATGSRVETDAVDRSATPHIVVIGVGYVGEHLVNVFSRRFKVIGYDISPERAQLLAQKFWGNKRILITSDKANLRLGTHFLIAVPTLLRADKTVDSSFLKSALDTVGKYARFGSTIVIESSVAVGMTRGLLGPLALTHGFYAGMSPERVDPGRTEPPAHAIPKIVSGLDDMIPGSLNAIRRVYNAVFDEVVSVSSPEVAEMTKLFENCQRMICIAFANEMADACEVIGISAFEVCEAAATKPFGYMPMMPSLGVGGHCIPVNPYYLLSTNDFPLLQAATVKMNDRPAHIAHQSIGRLYKRLGLHLDPAWIENVPRPVLTPADSDTELGRLRRLRWEADPVLQAAMRRFGLASPLNGDRDVDGFTHLAHDGSSTEALDDSDEGFGARETLPTPSPPPLPDLPRVLVVGIGFKAGQSHLVNSPGVALAKSLHDSKKVSVKWCDPLVTQLGFADIPRFDETCWTRAGLEEGFDMIIVAFRQHGLDFGVLQGLQGVDVEMWCP